MTQRLSAAGGSGGQIKLLALHPADEDAQGRGRCYVEYREAIGWDAGLDASGSDLGRQAVVVHALADTPDEGVRCWYRGQLPIPLGTEITLPVAGMQAQPFRLGSGGCARWLESLLALPSSR